MTERLPIFPLGTVLFPGRTLPLHIFEDRYRRLVRDLLETAEPRRFGVLSIEMGHEVGPGAARRIARTGCTAELRSVQRHDDGRYDLVTTGGSRFRVDDFHDAAESLPYLRADVTLLPEPTGTGAEAATGPVAAQFRRYRERLAAHGVKIADLGEAERRSPVELSYSVAASLVLDRSDKQRLLEAEHALSRLRLEYTLLRRENRLLEAFPTVPASEFVEAGINPN